MYLKPSLKRQLTVVRAELKTNTLDSTSPRGGYFAWFIFIIAALFYCYEYLLRIVPGVMQPELRAAFGHISASAFGNLSAYYYYAYTPMQIPVGLLMDRFGPHKLLSMASLLCAVGAGMFANAQGLMVAALGRTLVGFGSAFAFVGVLSLVNAWLPQRVFAFCAGLTTTLGMIGAMLGEIGLTLLVQHMGWHATLQWSARAGIVVCLLILLFVKDSPEARWQAPSVRRLSKELGLLLINSQIWLIGLCGALLYLSLSVFAEVWGKSYLVIAHHLTNLQAATSVSMVFLGWAIGGPVAGFLSDYFENRVIPMTYGAILAMISVAALIYIPNLPHAAISIFLFLYGFFCAAEIIVFALARENCDPKMAGTAIAVINMLVMLGGVVFQPLFGKLMDVLWSGMLINHVRIYSMAEYQMVFSILPLSLGLVAVLSFFIKETHAHASDGLEE